MTEETQKEPWEMTKSEFMKQRDWGAEPMAAIPGEPIEFIGKDWDKSPAALFFTDKEDKVYIQRVNGTFVYNPETKTKLFDDSDKAWEEYHRQEVKYAVEQGKSVSAEVLAEYPDLLDVKKIGIPEVPIVDEMMQASAESIDELRDRVSNVRYGPVEGEKGSMLFEFDGETYKAPELYPYIVTGMDKDKTIALRQLLDKKAVKWAKKTHRFSLPLAGNLR